MVGLNESTYAAQNSSSAEAFADLEFGPTSHTVFIHGLYKLSPMFVMSSAWLSAADEYVIPDAVVFTKS